MNIKAILFLLFFVGTLQAQEKEKVCACCSTEHQAFDFWIGDWVVYDTDGNEIGMNKIVSIQDHCILQENWASEKSTGSSYNYYNRKEQSWNQVWVDNFGNPLVLKGKFEQGKMTMRSVANEKGMINKVSWQLMSDGSVLQLWETEDKDGKFIKELFKGIYKKAGIQEK